MRISAQEHKKHQWEVHQLLADFRIEDVWRLPIIMESEQSLALVREQFSKTTKNIETKGPASWLFRLRLFVGHLFNWDKKISHTELIAGSIRERYAQKNGVVYDQLPDPGNGHFTPVYNLVQESLSEIDNATVHAAIHLGRVPIQNNRFKVQMTIYVKPKRIFGQLYMLLIKPFRLFIVYPFLMKSIKKEWELYVKSTS